MKLRTLSMTLTTVVLVAGFARAAEEADMFPFPIQPFSIGHDATDLSWMNEKPAGKKGFVRAKDGRFVDGAGKRIRLLGVNLCNSGAFPEHADAEKVAARLAKLGVNCVRLHHMDGAYKPRGIWDPAYQDHQHIDSGQLDKLDYLIYQLKIHGIYVDINLHVSRQFSEADGFPDTDKLPKYDKGLDNFEPRMISLQKEYARTLLTHPNPYTRTRYVDEPAVAMIEINNENSLVDYCIDGNVTRLPEHYIAPLRLKWISWLRRKYATTSKLKEAWHAGGEPIGENILTNPDFYAGTARWVLEAPAPAKAEMEVVDGGPSVGGRCLHARMLRTGREPWHFQIHQIGLDLKDGKPYTLRFAARANQVRKIDVYAGLDQAPWRRVGLSREVELSPEWRRYEFTFHPSWPEKNHNRISFNLQNEVGEVWIADVELRPGGPGLPDSATLEAGNIPIPADSFTSTQKTDFLDFAAQVERAYAVGMRTFIKDELGAKSLVVDTQVSYSGIAGVYRESLLDYGDMHGYWQHPSFPHKSWDPVDWRIRNTSMVQSRDNNTLIWMAMHRIAGKPFVVSEYNHPAPSDYSAECVPMLASFAALQDWDGIFLFDYHSGGEWQRDAISGFFQIDTHPAKIAFLPAAAAMFRRVDVAPLGRSATLEFPLRSIPGELAHRGTNVVALWESCDFPRTGALSAKTSVRLTDSGHKGKVVRKGVGSTSTMTWRADSPDASVYTISSPATRGAVGFLAGRSIKLGGLTIEAPGQRGKFAAITVTSLDGMPLERSTHLLISAVGRVENTGMVWDADRTSVGSKWGAGPSVAEGIRATLKLSGAAEDVKAFALDGGGGRLESIPCGVAKSTVTLNLGPEWRTLWYELVLER